MDSLLPPRLLPPPPPQPLTNNANANNNSSPRFLNSPPLSCDILPTFTRTIAATDHARVLSSSRGEGSICSDTASVDSSLASCFSPVHGSSNAGLVDRLFSPASQFVLMNAPAQQMITTNSLHSATATPGVNQEQEDEMIAQLRQNWCYNPQRPSSTSSSLMPPPQAVRTLTPIVSNSILPLASSLDDNNNNPNNQSMSGDELMHELHSLSNGVVVVHSPPPSRQQVIPRSKSSERAMIMKPRVTRKPARLSDHDVTTHSNDDELDDDDDYSSRAAAATIETPRPLKRRMIAQQHQRPRQEFEVVTPSHMFPVHPHPRNQPPQFLHPQPHPMPFYYYPVHTNQQQQQLYHPQQINNPYGHGITPYMYPCVHPVPDHVPLAPLPTPKISYLEAQRQRKYTQVKCKRLSSHLIMSAILDTIADIGSPPLKLTSNLSNISPATIDYYRNMLTTTTGARTMTEYDNAATSRLKNQKMLALYDKLNRDHFRLLLNASGGASSSSSSSSNGDNNNSTGSSSPPQPLRLMSRLTALLLLQTISNGNNNNNSNLVARTATTNGDYQWKVKLAHMETACSIMCSGSNRFIVAPDFVFIQPESRLLIGLESEALTHVIESAEVYPISAYVWKCPISFNELHNIYRKHQRQTAMTATTTQPLLLVLHSTVVPRGTQDCGIYTTNSIEHRSGGGDGSSSSSSWQLFNPLYNDLDASAYTKNFANFVKRASLNDIMTSVRPSPQIRSLWFCLCQQIRNVMEGFHVWTSDPDFAWVHELLGVKSNDTHTLNFKMEVIVDHIHRLLNALLSVLQSPKARYPDGEWRLSQVVYDYILHAYGRFVVHAHNLILFLMYDMSRSVQFINRARKELKSEPVYVGHEYVNGGV
jgi:hypothetical protein